MKLVCSFFSSYSHFFFQEQTTLSMKDFFYNRHDSGFTFVANHRHLENLSADRNGLNFRALCEKFFIDGYFSGVRMLADTYTTCFRQSACQQQAPPQAE